MVAFTMEFSNNRTVRIQLQGMSLEPHIGNRGFYSPVGFRRPWALQL